MEKVKKIPQRKCLGCMQSFPKKELIRGVIQTAKQLGLKVLTEGVESDEQFEILKEVGCDQAQGYRFSKPLPFEEHIKTFNK